MKNLRLGASLFAVLVALLPAATPVEAASCNGASHQSTLSRGTVTPGTVSAGQAVTFSVLYADSAGCAPSKVTVTVTGAGTFPLRGSGTTYVSGVTFSASVTLPAGTRTYTFSATSGGGNGTTTVSLRAVSPTEVVVLAATPVATPSPTAVAVAPTARPPTAPSVVAPAPQPPAPPPGTPAASPTASAQPTATGSPSAAGATASSTPGTDAAALGPMHDSWVGAPAAPPTNDGTARPPAEEAVGTFLASELPRTVGTFATATAGGLALFFLLIRRRRSQPRVVTAEAAAVGSTTGAASLTLATASEGSTEGSMKLNLRPIRELVPPLDPYLLEDPNERIGPSADEAGIPRWLRPSVRAARMGTLELRQRDWKA